MMNIGLVPKASLRKDEFVIITKVIKSWIWSGMHSLHCVKNGESAVTGTKEWYDLVCNIFISTYNIDRSILLYISHKTWKSIERATW